jgi:hypothetical protein
MIRRRIRLRRQLELSTTLAPLVHGRGDRTIRLTRDEAWLAFRVGAEPVTLRLVHESPSIVEATAWGPGAEAALAGVPALIGE